VEFSALNNGSVLNEVARHLEVMLSHLRSSGIRIKEILTEPGRIISGPSELLILSVLDVIEQPEGYNYLICDGGAMSLSPLLFTEYHKIMPLNSGNGRSLNYTVLGNMPSTLDKLSSSVHLPRLRTGDRIALLDTGAYFVSMNNNFAGPRPAIVLIDGQKAQLTRRRESIEDMYQRDYF
jgi:diaminopimelate decarboxylase